MPGSPSGVFLPSACCPSCHPAPVLADPGSGPRPGSSARCWTVTLAVMNSCKMQQQMRGGGQQLKRIFQDPGAGRTISIKYNLKNFAFWRTEERVTRPYCNHQRSPGCLLCSNVHTPFVRCSMAFGTPCLGAIYRRGTSPQVRA